MIVSRTSVSRQKCKLPDMFIGHFAVGLASKKFAPRANMAVLIAAPLFLDMLWPVFLLLGW